MRLYDKAQVLCNYCDFQTVSHAMCPYVTCYHSLNYSLYSLAPFTDYQREEESRYYKFRTRCQMVCCLKDDYGFIDKVTEWTRCKLITVTLIWITIIGLLVMRLFVYDGGFLGFAACILTIYYVVTLILANVKPHGIYVLCKGDAMALKVRIFCLFTTNNR